MKDIKKVIEGLEKYIDTDISEIIAYHEKKNSQEIRKCGHHSIACLIFCCVDLSAIVYGKNNANPVKFIKEYFKDAYKQKSLLVYKMWRHGTVHENDPKVFTNGHNYLGWCTVLLSAEENRKEHLKVYPKEDNLSQYCIVLNLPQLLINLKDSIEKLSKNLNANDKLLRSLSENYEEMTKPEPVKKENKLADQFDQAINIADIKKAIDKNGLVKDARVFR